MKGDYRNLIQWYSETVYPLEERTDFPNYEIDWIKQVIEGNPNTCCYLVYNEITNYCKIGITSNLRTRIQNIRTSTGCEIHLLSCVEPEIGYDESCETIEKTLHKFYKAKRKYGEWFSLSIRDVLEIRQLFMFVIEGVYAYDGIREVYESICSRSSDG